MSALVGVDVIASLVVEDPADTLATKRYIHCGMYEVMFGLAETRGRAVIGSDVERLADTGKVKDKE